MPQIVLSETPLIALRHIGVADGKKEILKDVSLKVRPREIVTVAGPNGAGKTTLLTVVLGIRKPTSGVLRRRKNLTVGYMPQKLFLPKMIPLTVKRFLRLDGDYGFDALREVLETTGIADLAKTDVHLLSGGEIQRMLLARALLRKPDLLVLDEPVQGLDAGGEEDFYALLKVLNRTYGCAVLMVSHDLHVVMAATDKVVCLNRHVCCEGKPSEIAAGTTYESLFGRKNLAFYAHKHDHRHGRGGRIVYDD